MAGFLQRAANRVHDLLPLQGPGTARTTAWVLSLSMLLLAGAHSERLVAAEGDGGGVPSEIRQYVTRQYPDYYLLQRGDLDQEMVVYLSRRQITKHPEWTTGDFDGNGSLDYALLLTEKGQPICRVTVMVVLRQRGGSLQGLVLERAKLPGAATSVGRPSVGICLSSLRQGTEIVETSAVPGGKEPKRVRLRADGVQLSFFERSAKVFYFEDGEFKSLWTAD